jgi:hypothetical protein
MTGPPSVVTYQHGTQDVCMVSEVRKYHSMCEMVDSVSLYRCICDVHRVFAQLNTT